MGKSADAVASPVKGLLIAAGVMALSLGIAATVIFGLDDQGILVSPPEITAEEFVRALGTGRVPAARGMLVSEAERTTSIPEMMRISRAFRSRLGHPHKVVGAIAERRRDTTLVRAQVKGERDSSELMLPLVRERGIWSVALAGESLLAVVQTPAGAAARR